MTAKKRAPRRPSFDVDAVLARHAALVETRGPRCFVEASENRALIEALCVRTINGRPLQHAAVARILKAETGEEISPDTISRHRQRECRCAK